MSARNAFAPLAGLLSTVNEAVEDRAHVLYGAARIKAGKGSGHEPASDIMGNIVAYAAVCLHLAAMEIEGATTANQLACQRHSTLRPAQYKILLGILQAVLPLQGIPSTSTTPKTTPKKRSSAVALDAASDELHDDLTTPTKPCAMRTSARTSASRTTPTSASASTRTTPRSKRLQELAQPSFSSKGKQKMEDDMDEEAGKDKSGSGLRRSTRSVQSPSTVRQQQQTTPTKPSPAKKARIDTSAFEEAISAVAVVPSPSPSPTKSASARKAASVALPVVAALQQDETEADVSEEVEVPYEPYLDDMLFAWRSKKGVRRLLRDTELWRQNMLQKLEEVS